jgi:predicted transcriptional regulator
MPKMIGTGLSRREREMLDVLHRRGRASAAEVLGELASPPSYSAVRSILRILEEKGLVRHQEQGKRYLYLPTQSPRAAARSALKQVVANFFGGSLERAVKTFLSAADTRVSDDELRNLSQLIKRARQGKGKP